MIDKAKHIEIFKSLVSEFYPNLIDTDYGESGVRALKILLDSIQEIYKYLNVRDFKSITIYKLDDISYIRSLKNCKHITQFTNLVQFCGPSISIQIINDEECYILLDNIDEKIILEKTFIYKKQKAETIITKNRTTILPNIPDADSYFSINTFKSLEEALEHYKTSVAKPGICPILEKSFYKPNRLFFIPGPEHYLRDSLVFCLRLRLRGNPEVRPEQNIDGTHPIDVKVSWLEAKHIALIEIKWLGKSIKDDGTISNYSNARANSGAKQLSDYLDANFSEVPTHITRGYLVIFDLRRKNRNNHTEKIPREDGFYYQDKEINFTSQYHNKRTDFHIPIRMFINPHLESYEFK